MDITTILEAVLLLLTIYMTWLKIREHHRRGPDK